MGNLTDKLKGLAVAFALVGALSIVRARDDLHAVHGAQELVVEEGLGALRHDRRLSYFPSYSLGSGTSPTIAFRMSSGSTCSASPSTGTRRLSTRARV